MKAIVQDRYGSPDDVLQLREIDKPVAGDDEVLVRVRAASVHPDVWHLLTGLPYVLRLMGAGLRKPKNSVPGTDVAGIIESVGKNITRFGPGDEVFGETIRGHQWANGGAYAEYATAPEFALAPKPANVTFEEAAAVPMAAVTALHGLRDKGRIQPGQKVLINGASGGVGTFAVQIAKYFGAEVTGVCSTRNLDMVRSMGADQVIDYSQVDFTKSGEHYDLILAANGYHSIWEYRRALSPGGIYVMSGGSGTQIFQAMFVGPWISMAGSRKMCNFVSKPNTKDLTFVAGLLESGDIVPVIDKCYKLSEVPEAIRYLEEEHARGKVVITLGHSNES